MLLRADRGSYSCYSLTQRDVHTRAFPHSLSYSLTQTIGFSVMYFKFFIEIFVFHMYIQRHTPYQLLVDIGCYGLVRRAFTYE